MAINHLAPPTGNMADNVVGFARALRAAGLPVGPGAVIDALNALQAIEIGNRADVFATLQGYLGSRYVNDFNRFGRTWQVVVQADAPYRYNQKDIYQLKTRNKQGDMVPLGALGSLREVTGREVL